MFSVPESPQVPQYCLQWALNLASKLVDPGRLVGVQPPLVVELDDVVLVVLESVVESREPLVGVPVNVVDEAEPRFGTIP